MAKLTRQNYKRRKIVAGAALFMSVALIATGFASFVISSSKTQKGQGNVTVGTISDAGLDITLNNSAALGTISFEAAKDDTTGRVTWNGTDSENLKITVSGSVANSDHLNKLTISMAQVGGTGISEAATANYIVLPACMTEAKEVTVGTDGSFEYEITFAWGTKFGGVNPSLYYDEGEGLAVSDAEVMSTLTTFRNLVYGVTADDAKDELGNATSVDAPKFEVTLTATAN